MKAKSLFFAATLLAVSLPAGADPVAALTHEGISVTLYNEPCDLPAVTNLPYRAIWQEKGKTTEGCFGVYPEAGAVVAYFDDKTVALMPMQAFAPVKVM